MVKASKKVAVNSQSLDAVNSANERSKVWPAVVAVTAESMGVTSPWSHVLAEPAVLKSCAVPLEYY